MNFPLIQDETSYVLKEPVTTSNLIDFVYNFTTNKLDRHLRNDDTSNHSHYYNPVDTHSSKNYHPQRVFESITLPTISSANFTDFIWEKNKVSLPDLFPTKSVQSNNFSFVSDGSNIIHINSMCILHNILEYFAWCDANTEK